MVYILVQNFSDKCPKPYKIAGKIKNDVNRKMRVIGIWLLGFIY